VRRLARRSGHGIDSAFRDLTALIWAVHAEVPVAPSSPAGHVAYASTPVNKADAPAVEREWIPNPNLPIDLNYNGTNFNRNITMNPGCGGLPSFALSGDKAFTVRAAHDVCAAVGIAAAARAGTWAPGLPGHGPAVDVRAHRDTPNPSIFRGFPPHWARPFVTIRRDFCGAP
jgi:hypothetical protein